MNDIYLQNVCAQLLRIICTRTRAWSFYTAASASAAAAAGGSGGFAAAAACFAVLISSKHICFDSTTVLNQCTAGWKSFARAGGQANSQYGAWGSSKTGHGCNWPAPGVPPAYYTQELARTFAPKVAGMYTMMRFNSTTSTFQLEYTVGAKHVAALPTEIFVWPERYPGGANVSVLASAGQVRVDYDDNASKVLVYATEGMQMGSRVTVSISKKL